MTFSWSINCAYQLSSVNDKTSIDAELCSLSSQNDCLTFS